MADIRNTDPEKRELSVPQGFEDVVLTADYTIVAKCRALYVGTAGTVIASVDGVTFHTFKNCAAGTNLIGAFKNVKSTANGTTAADIVACL